MTKKRKNRKRNRSRRKPKPTKPMTEHEYKVQVPINITLRCDDELTDQQQQDAARHAIYHHTALTGNGTSVVETVLIGVSGVEESVHALLDDEANEW